MRDKTKVQGFTNNNSPKNLEQKSRTQCSKIFQDNLPLLREKNPPVSSHNHSRYLHPLSYPDNTEEALQLYYQDVTRNHGDKKSGEIISQTNTCVNKYCLPSWGFPGFSGTKATREELRNAVDFRRRLRVEDLKLLLSAFDDTVEKLGCSNSIRYTYRSRLNDFLEWCESQPWFPSNSPTVKFKDRCPTNRYMGYGGADKVRLTDRDRLEDYGLKKDEIPDFLATQLKEFTRFRTNANYPHRLEDAVKSRSCENQIKYIKLILGWHYRYRNIPLDSLSLSILVPPLGTVIPHYPFPINDLEDVVDYVDTWLCEFLDFLIHERNCKSPHTTCHTCMCVTVVAKFIFLKLGAKDHYHNIPVITLLHRRASGFAKEIPGHQPVSDLSKKWLDLPDVIEFIVEPLRLECQRRYATGTLRTVTSVMQSVQRYCLWGCLTYLAPRRQQEWGKARVTLSCPIERPNVIPASGFVHPLPSSAVRYEERYFPYLYYNDEGKWILDLPPESYKTGKTHGYQMIEIPNRRFRDGRCFYDYLEMWLYGYFFYPDGTLGSGGTNLDYSLPQLPPLMGGRYSFPVNHSYCFTKYNGTQLNDVSFGSYIEDSAHQKTGQCVTPHLLRDIYATYFLDMEYSDAVIESLAYNMGHTVKELRKSYDARRSGDKRRPLETALTEVLDQIHGTSSSLDNPSGTFLQEIMSNLSNLSAGDRAKLKQIL